MYFILQYILIPSWLIISVYYTIRKIFFTKYKKPIIISIDGNIGSGKSTLIADMKKQLKNNKNIIFLQEPVKDWISLTDDENDNILNKFYKDKNRWAYIFQNFAFITRAKIMLDAINENKYSYFQEPKVIITERSVETDKNVFAKMLFEDKNMTDLEFKVYNEWYNYLYPEIKVNNVVYLRTLPQTAYERMSNRSRKEESTVPKDYIQMVHKFHDDWLTKHNENYNICYLNGDKDIKNDEKALKNHITKIQMFIKTLT
jgi:deoxyadenosine/deoxycytidine kinase